MSTVVSGSVTDWLEYGLACHDRPALPQNAERFAKQFVERIAGAMVRSRSEFLAEDYLAFAMTGVSGGRRRLLATACQARTAQSARM